MRWDKFLLTSNPVNKSARIPTKPIKGLAGDFIFKKKNIVKKLSRTQKSDIYCTGIQILNPKKINDKIKPTDLYMEER